MSDRGVYTVAAMLVALVLLIALLTSGPAIFTHLP